MTEYHSQFPGSVKWRITGAGVDIEGKGVEAPSAAEDVRAQKYMSTYTAAYAQISVELAIPVELLIACSLTESAAVSPETCFREEPGYVEPVPYYAGSAQSGGFAAILANISTSFCLNNGN